MAKMIGHIVTTEANITDTIDDRLHKANAAWQSIRKSFITNLNIDTSLGLNYYEALITTVLIYSIHLRPINETAAKIQPLRPYCIKYIIINGRYTSGNNKY